MFKILGKGSYGEVYIRNGKAVKKFHKLTHLIQEYTALIYLTDCEHIVHAYSANFSELELEMELYETSLRKWLEDRKWRDEKNLLNKELSGEIAVIIRDILLGLIELHDRNLVHGDIKPGNILLNKFPLKCVLGDCGFVSIGKYSKVERTAAIYRETNISHNADHDMFSFGICLLELIGGVRLNRQPSYGELHNIIRDNIELPRHKMLIKNLLVNSKKDRYTSREVLNYLFNESPVRPSDNSSNSFGNGYHENNSKYIRNLMKEMTYRYDINRGRRGYGAISLFIDNKVIDERDYIAYTLVTVLILSAIFGKSKFKEKNILELSDNRYTMQHVYKFLDQLLADQTYVNFLFSY